MEQVRRLNHWVPESYLVPFTETGTKDGNITAFRRDSPGKSLYLPPRALAKERDLYVVSGDDGRLDDSLERMLADHVEGPFIPVRNALAFGRLVGITDRLTRDGPAALSFFCAFQLVRTPKFREQFNLLAGFSGNFLARAHLEDLDAAHKDFEKVAGGSYPIEEVRKFRDDLDAGRVRIEPSDKLWLETATKLALDIQPLVDSLPKRVVHLPRGFEVPTSDLPVTVVSRKSRDEYLHGGGLIMSGTEITLPLSPSSVLVMGNSLQEFYDQGSAAWGEQLRHRIATGADQWLFARDDDKAGSKLLWESKSPVHVLDFNGGSLRPGEPYLPAVRNMMENNDGEAFIMFRPRGR